MCSDISYTQPISDNLQLSQWQTNLKIHSLTKTLYQSVFITDLEQTPFFLKSDLNINNFDVLLHFLVEIVHISIFFSIKTFLVLSNDQSVSCLH